MKFKIKNYDYEILEVEEDSKELNGNSYGVTDYNLCKIYLQKDLNNRLKKETLIHELCHTFMGAYGHNTSNERIFDIENVCEIMAVFAEDILEIANKYFK